MVALLSPSEGINYNFVAGMYVLSRARSTTTRRCQLTAITPPLTCTYIMDRYAVATLILVVLLVLDKILEVTGPQRYHRRRRRRCTRLISLQVAT